jgi:uncharacterized protein (DUF433 family)
MSKDFYRITFDPRVMGGQPCMSKIRIPISQILTLLANGKTKDEILSEYPDLEDEDIRQELAYAAKKLSEKAEIEKRLSSDNLYHFTGRKDGFSTLKKIVKTGFRFGLQNEQVPHGIIIQQNFAVCFCDIRIDGARFHRKYYGNNALVLTKT